MSGENYSNLASTATASASVGPSDTTATLANFTGWPATPFWGEFEKGTVSAEIVRVTNVAGTTITMTRGEGGTSATSHGAGATFEHIAPAVFFNDLEAHKNATGGHGVTGNIVGTSGSQTVADKLFRGALLSKHTDALPAGITASVETVADSAAARDGHVHRNTGGDADKRGFLLEQSGTARFQAFNDGTVDVAPGTSSRPGLRNHGTTTLDGAVTVNSSLSTTGAVTSGGALTVSSGGATVTGNTTFNNNVTTTGTHTAKTYTTPVPAGGDTADRVTINTRTGAKPLVVKNESAVQLAALDSSGVLNTLGGLSTVGSVIALGGMSSWGGRVAVSVASTSSITTPTTGDVIYDRSDGRFKRWGGSSWIIIRSNPPRFMAQQTGSQVMGSGNWIAVEFNVINKDTADGWDGGNPTRYTAQYTGWYTLNGAGSWAATSAGSRGVRYAKNGTAISNSDVLLPATPGGSHKQPGRSFEVFLDAGDYVELELWQNSGGNISTTGSSFHVVFEGDD